MSNNLPDYPFKEFDFNEEYIDQIGSFETILLSSKGLVNQGFISDSFLTSDDPVRKQKIDLQTAASWLWNLGYLKDEIEPRKIKKIYSQTNVIQNAVKDFQKEANLEVNGLVDNFTWYALDSLVSFESETGIDNWFKGNTALPVLHRAVQLRLFSFGLYDQKPTQEFKPLTDKDLMSFIYVVHLFHLSDKIVGQGLFRNTLKLLFNQEQIIAKVAKSHNEDHTAFKIRMLTEIDSDYQHLIANRFVINLAKIELWLLGLDVDIDGKDDSSIWQNTSDTNSKLVNALSDYYHKIDGIGNTESGEKAQTISPSFFISLQNTYHEYPISSENDLEDVSQLIFKKLDSEKKIEIAWDYIKEKGMQLWDGLKRIWSWIKRMACKFINFVEGNIYRAFFRYISKSFKIVKKAMFCVTESITTYLSGTLPTNYPSYVSIHFGKDFDFEILINPDTGNEKIQVCAEELKNYSVVFSISTKIIGLIFNVFKNIVTGVYGWTKLLLTLLRGLREIRPLYEQLNDLELADINCH